MQKYELTVLLDSKITTSKKKAVGESIEKVVGLSKGKIGKVEDWGQKEAGIYLYFPLELTPEGAKALLAKVALEKEFKRYLLKKVN